jgi:AraC-like DNA-binding protein
MAGIGRTHATRTERFDVARASLSIGAMDLLRGTQLRHEFAPHMHEFFAIGVIDDGASRVRYRGSTTGAGAGAIVTISAGETHTGGPGAEGGWSYRMIYPQPGLFRLALEHTIGADEPLLFQKAFVHDRGVRRAFDAAYRALRGSGCSLATEESVLGLLRLLALKHSSRPPRPTVTPSRTNVVRVARDYIHAHFAERVCLSSLAGVCGVSPFHLIRVFRKAVGVPPHAYLKQLRVARAMTMLGEGTAPAHVAYACGFSDQSHLTRAFKSTYGFPPGVYQRASRASAVVPSVPLHVHTLGRGEA